MLDITTFLRNCPEISAETSRCCAWLAGKIVQGLNDPRDIFRLGTDGPWSPNAFLLHIHPGPQVLRFSGPKNEVTNLFCHVAKIMLQQESGMSRDGVRAPKQHLHLQSVRENIARTMEADIDEDTLRTMSRAGPDRILDLVDRKCAWPDRTFAAIIAELDDGENVK